MKARLRKRVMCGITKLSLSLALRRFRPVSIAKKPGSGPTFESTSLVRSLESKPVGTENSFSFASS